jgi:hypothetical protein
MIQEAVWKLYVASTVLVIGLVLTGCQKTPRQPSATPSVSPGATTAAGKPAAGQLPSAGTPAPAPRSAAVPPAPPAPPVGASQTARPVPGPITLSHDVGDQAGAGPRPPSTAAGLMALDREKRLLPEDFKIGPLGEARGGKSDENDAVGAANAFLASIVAGKVDPKLLAPESEKTVSDTISFGLRQGNVPRSFRVGTPKLREDGEITATVRLFGDDGTSEGEIYMSHVGKLWLVSDLQLSLAQLAVKKEKPKEKFFPSTYRWLLED